MRVGKPERTKVAIVTGAGRGIGRATALTLAERGDRVLAVSRTEDELATLAEHSSIDMLVESVSTVAGCERIIDVARARLGPPSILVSNAGVGSYGERPVWEQELPVWRESLAVNLEAAFHLIRLATPDMISIGWGRIVIVSSTAANVGAPSNSAYSAAKAGVLGLMRAVAQDVIPYGITCNAVLPGWVRTDMANADAEAEGAETERTAAEVWQQRAAEYAAGRVLEPVELAHVISFLTSEEASGINGEEITVSLGSAW